MRPISIIAHRGGAALKPENTMAAFARAVELGVDGVECDVHMMQDGQVVVFHDFSLLQLTGQEGYVEAIDEVSRQKLRIMGGNEPPPLLEELAAMLAKTSVRLYLEIKTNGHAEHERQLAEKSLAILRACHVLDKTSVISFEPACLTPFIAAGVSCGLCLDNPDALFVDIKKHLQQWWDKGYRDLSLNGGRSSLGFVKAAVDFGFHVGVWTINGPARLAYWLGQPVNYITTDQPDLALSMLKDKTGF